MSLQVWMPLRGDLRNQGLSDQTSAITTTPTWATVGKLGDKSLYTKTRQTTMHFPGLVGVSTYSVAYWLYIPTAIAPTAWADMFGIAFNCAGTTVWERDERRAATTTGRHNYHLAKSTSEGSNTNAYYGTREDDSANDNWVHYVLTKDNSSAKLYADGTLVVTVPAANFESTKRTMTGDVYFGDNGCEAYLNDFRIYDHCLSPMEVKELAKGLVLHYPLNRQGWGQENLVTNSINLNNFINESATYVSLARTSSDLTAKIITTPPSGSRYGFYQDIDCTVSTQYTVSFEVVSMSGDFACAVGSRTGNSVGWSNLSGYTTCTVGKNIKTFTTISDCTKLRIYMGALSNNSILVVKNVKLEKGSVATPWCPNSSDTLATTMGLNSTTEYDCSGFCNNGTRTGTFSWTSDTPKYAVSQVFNGTDNAIQTPNLTTMVTDKNYTVACWTYKTVIGTKNYQTIYGGPSGFELEARSSSSTSPLYRIHNWGGGTTAYNFGEWTHFCFVHTDSDSKLYVNGELKITGSSANVPSGNYFVGAWNTSTSQNYEGNMSDFRIYATALSADDVKSLYQNSAYIDSSGNVYGAIHMEA